MRACCQRGHAWCVNRRHTLPFVVLKVANLSCGLLLSLGLSLISQTTKRNRAALGRKIAKVSFSLLRWGRTLDRTRACWLNTLQRFSGMEPGLIGLMQGSTTEPLPLGGKSERQTRWSETASLADAETSYFRSRLLGFNPELRACKERELVASSVHATHAQAAKFVRTYENVDT